MKVGLLVQLILVCLLFTTKVVAKEDIDGFQGLKWGSSEAEVLAKFPAAQKSDSACNKKYQSFLQGMGYQCQTYELRDYKIENYGFNLQFRFDINTGKLASVELSPSFELYALLIARKASIVAVYLFLKEGLTSKYGNPTNVIVSSYVFDETSEWRSEKTKIKLNASFHKEMLSPTDEYFGDFYLDYKRNAVAASL